MDCYNCIVNEEIWVWLRNGSQLCIKRLSSIGSSVVKVIVEKDKCGKKFVKASTNYGLVVGVPLVIIGFILLMLGIWLKKRGQIRQYEGFLDDGMEGQMELVQPTQQPLPPLPRLIPAPAVASFSRPSSIAKPPSSQFNRVVNSEL